MSPERERYLAALEGQRVGWERLQAANREALRPVVDPVAVLVDRLQDPDPDALTAVLAHYRPRVMLGLDSTEPYWEMRAADLPDAMGEAVPVWYERTPPDAQAHDVHPDRCWRCDSLPGDAHLGLCEPCRESLT